MAEAGKKRSRSFEGGLAFLNARRRAYMRGWTIYWRDIWREDIPRLAFGIFALLSLGALTVGVIEYATGSDAQKVNYGSPINALYWAVVTLASVGYGDIAPQSPLGRSLTIAYILLSMVFVSVFTATLASVFTAKKIKEGRGLEKVKTTGHVVICGWSRHADTVIKFLSRPEQTLARSFVLINSLAEEQMNEVLYRFSHLDLHAVHGDFIQESVLRRANVEEARAAIILASEEPQERGRADNRTLQAALAIKAINPDIKLVAEALEPESEQHLRRANVDDIIVSGEFSGYLLAASATSPALHMAIRELLNVEVRNDLLRNPIPESLRGKTFADMHRWFREHGALAVGVIVEERTLSLDAMLVDDFSAVDRFIRSAFSAAGKDLKFKGRGKTEIAMNPPDDRIIGPDDDAIIIAPRQVPV